MVAPLRTSVGDQPRAAARAHDLPRIVIVGAGFGGLSAAKALRGVAAEVIVIDRRNYHLFQPLLYQVATAALSPADIAHPVRSALRTASNIEVRLDELVDVDVAHRRVLTATGVEIAYDYLVLATGSVYSYFGHADWPRLAPGLKSVEDATEIRRQLLLSFERAEVEPDVDARGKLLTFLIVGGGPTGVEMAGAVAELAKATLARDFRNIDPRAARIVLVEAGPRLLNGFPAHLGEYAVLALQQMDVDVRLNAAIEHIDEQGVVANGERIDASVIVWGAGVQATPVAGWLDAEAQGGGAVAVGPDLSLPGHPEIFVIGDAALARDREGNALPGLAAVASQQGVYVGNLLEGRIAGRSDPGPFAYSDWGTMATIGRSSAVADFRGFTMRGFFAWLLWGLVHIYLLIGFRNRLAVFIDWVWSWLTYGRGARLITGEVFAAPPSSTDDDKRSQQARHAPGDCQASWRNGGTAGMDQRSDSHPR